MPTIAAGTQQTVPVPANEPRLMLNPFRSNVPFTVVAELLPSAEVLPATNTPALTVVAPVYVFVPVKVVVPVLL